MGKKKKRAEIDAEAEAERNKLELEELINGDSHTKMKKKKKKKERNETEKEVNQAKGKPTVSIAVPGSIIDNAQSLELATRVIILSYTLYSLFLTINYDTIFLPFFFFSWLVRLLAPRPYFGSMRSLLCFNPLTYFLN